MTAAAVAPTAVVTGASRGLGEVVARLLTDQRYRVLATARTVAPLEAAAARLRSRGASVETLVGDVADAAVRRRARAWAESAGRLDVLVNNASALGPSPLRPLLELPPTTLAGILEVNTLAPLALVQELIGPLAAAGGLVVNISSDAAVGGYPGWGGYGSSKAALELLSRTLAHELADRRVAVVSVDPGDLRTELHQAAYPGQDITDRPLPEATLPFWVWLLHQDRAAVSGGRFRAQADRWELPR